MSKKKCVLFNNHVPLINFDIELTEEEYNFLHSLVLNSVD